MDFHSEFELRQELARYLKGQSALKEFEDWFVARSWNINQNSNPSLHNLVSQIELSLAEFGNGDWTEEELRQEFGILLTNYEFQYYPFGGETLTEKVSIRTGSGTNVLEFRLFALSLNVDIRPVAVSA